MEIYREIAEAREDEETKGNQKIKRVKIYNGVEFNISYGFLIVSSFKLFILF